MLVSFYNGHNRSIRVSGPDDKSASLFQVTRFVLLLKLALWLWPNAFRFVANSDGAIVYAVKPATLDAITEDRKRLQLSAEFLEKVKSQWQPVTGLYFLRKYRKRG